MSDIDSVSTAAATAVASTAPTPSTVAVVIVNYRTPELTVRCLRSLVDQVASASGTRVVVVDNDSGDGSAATIAQAITDAGWQDWVTLLPSTHNGGYAYGNNLGLRQIMASGVNASYYWLLNPDTEVLPGALSQLVNFLDQHPTVGIVGSELQYPNGSTFGKAFRFPNIWNELDNGLRLGIVSRLLSRWLVAQSMGDQPQAVDWLPGASMMVRHQVFEQVGLMDDTYFLYFEETDFCLQAHRAGWGCWYVPQSRVMHVSGQSTGVTAKSGPPRRRPQYWFDSRRRYFVKNHGWAYALLADVAWLGGNALWQVRKRVQGKPDTDPPHMFGDFLQNSLLLRPKV